YDLSYTRRRTAMRRTLAFLAALALFIPLLVACGGQTAQTGGTQATAPPAAPAATAASAATGGEKVKIRLATWTGVDEAKELQAVIDKINAKATTFEIVQEAQPADYYTKIQTNLAGGTAADLLWLSQ